MNKMTKKFFMGNRSKLMQSFPGHVLVVPAHGLLQRSADLAFPFRQDSNFWYLTGINEPDQVLVIDASSGESTLLVPQQSDYQKEWDGEVQTDEFTALSGIAAFDSVDSLPKRIEKAKKSGLKIGYLKPLDEVVQPYGFYSNPARRKVEAVIKKVESDPIDVRVELARLRQVKQPVEIDALQQAVDTTARTLSDVKSRLSDLSTEKEVERAITAGFFSHGADGHAYDPIVGSGKNAAIIHYTKNNSKLEKNNLVLIDVGAQVNGYAADITRTWSIGTPSERQKEVYDAVFELQQEAFAALKPGVILKEYQKSVEEKAEKIFKKINVTLDHYPHGFSHFLGLDVHDAGDYSQPLQEGVAITVEPGLYLPDEGIGVRIEDDVLITRNGVKILSEKIPKTL